MHLRALKFQNFPGEACPQTPPRLSYSGLTTPQMLPMGLLVVVCFCSLLVIFCRLFFGAAVSKILRHILKSAWRNLRLTNRFTLHITDIKPLCWYYALHEVSEQFVQSIVDRVDVAHTL